MNFAGMKRRLPPVLVLVVIVTLVFRLPSCRESFWLDELHSAWAVDGGFDEVGSRAVMGNQTTGYFHLLWIWKQCFASDEGVRLELALRSLGLTFSCLAAGVLTCGIAFRTRRVIAGLVAGLLFAVDPNAVFFGCELRPYGLVMLLAALAVASMMAWIGNEKGTPSAGELAAHSHDSAASEAERVAPGARNGLRDARWRLAMLFWICAAALIHPTSLGVLGWLIPLSALAALLAGKRWRGQYGWQYRWQWGWADGVALVVILITVLLLGNSSLLSSWERRDLWRAFGQAWEWGQFQRAWDWVPLLIIPVGAAACLMLSNRIVEKAFGDRLAMAESRIRQLFWTGLLPAIAALIGTLLFFLLSYYQWVPLWHRRYFIAAFPLLVWTAGECVGVGMHSAERLITTWYSSTKFSGSDRMKSGIKVGCNWLIGGAMVMTILWYQSTLPQLKRGLIPLQERREPWRGAVAAVREQRLPGQPVWLDSGLIEAAFLRDPVEQAPAMTDAQWNYLSFPLGGPYQLEPVLVVGCQEHDSWLRRHVAMLPPGETTVWLVARSSLDSTRQFVARLKPLRGVEATEVFGGNPRVIRLRFSP